MLPPLLLAAAALAAAAAGGPPRGADRARIGTLDVSALGVGTLNWPLDRRRDARAADALAASVRSGVCLFDTAEAYGYGSSERLLADCVARAGEPPVALATKFAPAPWRRSARDVVAACRASAARLGVSRVDLYQLHWPDVVQPLRALGWEERKDEAYWDGLAQCYELGLAANVGVSNYGPALLQRAHAALRARGVPLASCQLQHSLLCRDARTEATLAWCARNGVAALGYWPLADGLLAGRYTPASLPRGRKGAYMRPFVQGGATVGGVAYPRGGVGPLLEAMRGVGAARGKSVPQVALNYALCKGVIPIPGCRDGAMAAENAGALGWRLSAAEVGALEAAADSLGFGFATSAFVEDEGEG